MPIRQFTHRFGAGVGASTGAVAGSGAGAAADADAGPGACAGVAADADEGVAAGVARHLLPLRFAGVGAGGEGCCCERCGLAAHLSPLDDVLSRGQACLLMLEVGPTTSRRADLPFTIQS